MKEFPPFRLDTVNQCLWRCTESGVEERILLKPKAFAILRHLVDHAGRLVTQEELLSAVWPDVHVQLDVLKRHIFDIRNELGDDPKSPRFIETLTRRGYQFIAAVRDLGWAEPARDDTEPITKLVGRERALGELQACLARVVRGERQTVFVTGEPGIGKTALVEEFRRQASAGGPLRIARGQCIEGYGGKEAYYPVLEAVGKLCRGPAGEFAIDILAAQAPTWLVQFPSLLTPERRQMLQREILGTTKQRMLREIGDALETISAEIPLLLVLEDLHWADASTVDLVSALARGRLPAKLMVIGTYRPHDLATAAPPLTNLSSDLQVHHLCHQIALDLLEEEEISAYLDGASAGSAPKGLARVLHRHSEGNPLFMLAALETMAERGLISRESGSWRISVPIDAIDFEVPESLNSMIEAQIERLSPEEQGVLEVASPGTDVFSVAVRSPVANLEPDRFEEACETLSRRHHILRPAGSRQFSQGTRSPCYQFVHALYREVCYQRIAPSRRSKLHRRVGEQLELLVSERGDENAAELAEHFEKCADWARAVKYLILAARLAEWRFAPQEAMAILQRAHELVSKLPEAERGHRKTEVLGRLSALYVACADSRAIQIYEDLALEAARCGLIDIQARALIDLGFFNSWSNAQLALEAFEQALLLSGKQSGIAKTKTRTSCLFWRTWVAGWSPADTEECQRALVDIRDGSSGPELALHLIEYSFLQWASSEYRCAHRTAVEGVRMAADAGEKNPYSDLVFLLGRIIVPWSLLLAGEWGAALQEIGSGILSFEKNGDQYRRGSLDLIGAWIHLHAMDFESAHQICQSVLGFTQVETNAGRSPQARICLILGGAAALGVGNFDLAQKYFTHAREAMEREMVIHDWYWRMILEAGFTDLWLASEDLARARSQAEKFLDATLATAERTWRTLAWEANARVAIGERDFTRARECIAKGLADMEGFETPLAAWRIHATAFELYEILGRWSVANFHRSRSSDTIIELANSLPRENPLRQHFLSSSRVCRILGDRNAASLAWSD